MEKKATKLIIVFEDGSKEYIDGEDLENFIVFERAAYAKAILHGLKQDKVEWKKEK